MEHTEIPANETPDQRDIRLNKDIAAFSYIWIMSLVVYFSHRESKFVHFHSKQAIVLFLLTIPVSFIPYLGKYLVFLLAAAMLLGFINAAQGQLRDVPFIGSLSRGELKLADVVSISARTLRQGIDGFKLMLQKHREAKNAPSSKQSSVQPVAPPPQTAA